MTTAFDILQSVQSLAPLSMKMDWDNVGLLCGRASAPVHRILVALDPFEDVFREAIALEADCIVTHHPLIFSKLGAVTDETAVGRTVMELIRHDICAINAHTNLDCAPGGVNDCLAVLLGLDRTEVIDPQGTDSQGRPWGLLRMGLVPPQPLEAFLSTVKDTLGTPVLRYSQGCDTVRRVAVGGGACGSELTDAFRAGCDTFVTSDVKYNQFWDARDLGMNLIDAGHFYTENPVCSRLARFLQEKYPDIPVILSENHKDCMKFF